MRGFKRFCMVVFALVGLATMAALILPWIGPWTAQATALLALDWYLFLVELFLVLLAIGFLVILGSAIARRKPDDIQVADVEGGTIAIARSAVASQATYIVEADGTCVADRVRVEVRHGMVDVAVDVEPYHSMDVRSHAVRLQADLRRGLGTLVGDSLGEVTLRFEEPRTTADLTPGDVVRTSPKGGYVPTATHRADRDLRHAAGAAPERAVAHGEGTKVTSGGPALHVEATPADDSNEGGDGR